MQNNPRGLRRILQSLSTADFESDTDILESNTEVVEHVGNPENQETDSKELKSGLVAATRLQEIAAGDRHARELEIVARAEASKVCRETIISAGMTLDKGGTTTGADDDVYMYGKYTNASFDGINKLTIASGGIITGTVRCKTIHNHGILDGDIEADFLVVYKGSRTTGQVRCHEIAMQRGSFIEGSFKADPGAQTTISGVFEENPQNDGFEREFSTGLRLVSGNQNI